MLFLTKCPDTDCVPYSEEACRDIGKKTGLVFGSGSYGTKGCYVYKDGRYQQNIWYGTGGTDAQNTADIDEACCERPSGFDCKKGTMIFILRISR